jgi:hypothetical protein
MPQDDFLGIPNGLWGGLLFCLGLYFQTLIIRRIVEAVLPKAVNDGFWRDKVLPSIPFLLGALEAILMKKFPRPFESTAISILFVYGLTMGGASSWAYKVIKEQIKKKFGVDVDLSNPPPPGAEVRVQVKVPPQDKVPEDK